LEHLLRSQYFACTTLRVHGRVGVMSCARCFLLARRVHRMCCAHRSRNAATAGACGTWHECFASRCGRSRRRVATPGVGAARGPWPNPATPAHHVVTLLAEGRSPRPQVKRDATSTGTSTCTSTAGTLDFKGLGSGTLRSAPSHDSTTPGLVAPQHA